MKQAYKIYLESYTLSQLKKKAQELGFEGRNWFGKFLEYISTRDLIFLDNNTKKLLRQLALK